MGIKFRIVNILVLLVLWFTSFADNVSIDKAQTIAGNFFTEKMPIYNRTLLFGDEYVITNNDIPVYYVFDINDGFIIVAADDAVFPVLGYSFTSSYTGENFPIAFQNWMHQYKEQILYVVEKKLVASSQVKKAWQRYAAKNFDPDLEIESVEPMIQTTWSQGCYYNSQFPIDTTAPCGHLWTGCVATAMGQIMKYYNYPKSGTGSYGYNSSYGWVEADFENAIYDWAGMKNHLNEENYAIAELLYHAAISINSQFFSNGTGAFDFDARDALVDYFNYKSDAQFYWRDDYQGNWTAMLRNELDQGRPLLYGGVASETNAGHTLVCDGYQDTAFFHFNWGWDGYYNGYFYLDSLIAGENYFDFQHDAVVGIKPDINGIVELYPVENLMVSVDFNNVTLNWDQASINSSLELIGYNIFRNDTLLNESILTGLIYLDSGVPAGSHEYKVQSVFIGEGNGPSTSAEAYISDITQSYSGLFEVYPNPASEYIYIKNSTGNLKINSIEIYDLSGKIIYYQDLYELLSGIKTIALPYGLRGVYILKINTTQSVFTKKLLIDSN